MRMRVLPRTQYGELSNMPEHWQIFEFIGSREEFDDLNVWLKTLNTEDWQKFTTLMPLSSPGKQEWLMDLVFKTSAAILLTKLRWGGK